MNKVKVPFPRYLNAKKLFYIWEEDVVYISAFTGMVLFMMMLWLSINIIVSLVISLVVSFFLMKKYIRYFKKSRKGYVVHLLYSKGFSHPTHKGNMKKDFEENLLPYGFENEFIN